jgi:hypothetical protein
MDNPETQATSGTQDTGQKQTKQICCVLAARRTFDNSSLTSLRAVLIVILSGLNGISKNYIENQNALNHIFLFI